MIQDRNHQTVSVYEILQAKWCEPNTLRANIMLIDNAIKSPGKKNTLKYLANIDLNNN